MKTKTGDDKNVYLGLALCGEDGLAPRAWVGIDMASSPDRSGFVVDGKWGRLIEVQDCDDGRFSRYVVEFEDDEGDPVTITFTDEEYRV